MNYKIHELRSASGTKLLEEDNPLNHALKACKKVFWTIFWFAFVINVLMLITSVYALQVLDRVLGSGSIDTLILLTVIFITIYFVHSLVQIARSYTLIKLGRWLDEQIAPKIFAHAISSAATKAGSNSGTSQMLRDFQTIKTFLTSAGINSIFDAPWSIIYIIVCFMIHTYIGIIAIIGSIIIISFALFNAIATNRTLGEATEFSIKGLANADVAGRGAEAVEAMGMIDNVMRNWSIFNEKALEKQSLASYRNGAISNISRFFRSAIQVSVTCTGAYVVVRTGGQGMTAGGMIASSILIGRALAPFDNSIELWKSISSAMKSYRNIVMSFAIHKSRDSAMELPGVKGHFSAKNLYFAFPPPEGAPPNPTPSYVLQDVSFEIQPGQVVAIIGPSAVGKSTLAKIMVGVWQATSGDVRLDGAEVYRWNRKDFGRNVGYLPQGIELFSGSIKENIARMEQNPDPEKVIKAAKLAGAHDMILQFKDGYDSDIGIAGANLSGGQRQRVGLARAFYGDPKFMVLDEPNANLDEAGENALANALESAKKNKIAAIVISHRPSVLSVVDKVLLMQGGKVAGFGTQEEIKSQVTTLKSGTIHIND